MAGNDKGQRVNRTQLADVFGVSLPTVDGWVRAGCPVVQRGGRGVEWVFNTAAVAQWIKDRAVEGATGGQAKDLDDIEKRTKAARMSLAELELAKAKGEVAELRLVERMVSRAFAEVRANMRTLPGRLVASLIGETDERTFKRVMLAEIDLVLEALTNASLAEPEPEDEEVEDEPAGA